MKTKKIMVMATACVLSVVLIFVGLWYAGFFVSPVNVQARAVDTYATEESVDVLVAAINNFSVNMYHELGLGAKENVFFSPYSVFVALAMTYEGAVGETAEEMQQVLGFLQHDEVSLCSFGRLYNLLNIDAEYTLGTANALWTQKDYPFLAEYLDFVEQYYMGRATDVDFSDSAGAVDIINRWVAEHTHGKIVDMLSISDIHPLTRLILSNAIYFKGTWVTEFEVEDTVDRDFILSSSDEILVPTMGLTGSDSLFNYSENDDVQLLELPYKGDTVSMLVVLPKADTHLSTVEEMVTTENLSRWMDMMDATSVDIFLPKFRYETKYSLREILSAMGMSIAFSADADFSGMNGHVGLYIDKVLHNAFIEVNEEGTEAAAATTVHMVERALPEPQVVFNADHPFLYLIVHKDTGLLLFMGKVVDPR